MNLRKLFSVAVFLFSLVISGSAQDLDSIRVSLVTCSPGGKVYSLYGHTALRCQNFTRNNDWVFNYGVFSFNQPHFIWHFVLGQCDYMVLPLPWDDFLTEYRERGSSVTAQVLNLTPEESNAVFYSLVDNCRKENRNYKYNFLYNNCTTKVRDMIERCVDGSVVYPDTIPHYTYRQILHQYTAGHQWAQEGDDMLLGADVDTVLSARAAMFAPEYMMKYAANAVIRQDNNDTRPLVLETETILEKRSVPTEDTFPLGPLATSLCFLGFCVFVCVVERLCNRVFWIWDVLLLTTQGLAGALLLFLFLFSAHPAVGSNWLVWPFTPLAFLGLCPVVKSAVRKKKTLWHAFYFVYLALFLVFSPWIPQDFGNIVVPLATALLTRPVSYHAYYRRNKL